MTRYFMIVFALATLATIAFAEDVVITQKDKQFSETEISVKPGDTVIFTNADSFDHNVYSVSPGAEFGGHTGHPGSSMPVKMEKEGEILVRCAFHPSMKLKIAVKK